MFRKLISSEEELRAILVLSLLASYFACTIVLWEKSARVTKGWQGGTSDLELFGGFSILCFSYVPVCACTQLQP